MRRLQREHGFVDANLVHCSASSPLLLRGQKMAPAWPVLAHYGTQRLHAGVTLGAGWVSFGHAVDTLCPHGWRCASDVSNGAVSDHLLPSARSQSGQAVVLPSVALLSGRPTDTGCPDVVSLGALSGQQMVTEGRLLPWKQRCVHGGVPGEVGAGVVRWRRSFRASCGTPAAEFTAFPRRFAMLRSSSLREESSRPGRGADLRGSSSLRRTLQSQLCVRLTGGTPPPETSSLGLYGVLRRQKLSCELCI